eukprot:3379083-Rhodomonas_salina.1
MSLEEQQPRRRSTVSASGLRVSATRCPAMSGTDVAYRRVCALRGPRLAQARLSSYEVSGTEIGYAATGGGLGSRGRRCSIALWSYAAPMQCPALTSAMPLGMSSRSSYARPTRCPVLRSGMLLPGAVNASPHQLTAVGPVALSSYAAPQSPVPASAVLVLGDVRYYSAVLRQGCCSTDAAVWYSPAVLRDRTEKGYAATRLQFALRRRLVVMEGGRLRSSRTADAVPRILLTRGMVLPAGVGGGGGREAP